MTIERAPKWRMAKRLGLGGVLFFLVKGLLWMALPTAIALLKT